MFQYPWSAWPLTSPRGLLSWLRATFQGQWQLFYDEMSHVQLSKNAAFTSGSRETSWPKDKYNWELSVGSFTNSCSDTERVLNLKLKFTPPVRDVCPVTLLNAIMNCHVGILGSQVGDANCCLSRYKTSIRRPGLYYVLRFVNSSLEKENYYCLQCKTRCRLRFRKSFVSPVVRKWCVWALIFSSDATAHISDSSEIICKTPSFVWMIEYLP
jgi:hypothetical protein